MTAYEHLLELAADNVKRRGATQTELLCPAHEDRTPSLSLSIGRDENAVIHCHAGCPAADVMAAWPGGRLPVAALFDTYWTRGRDREPEASYDYVDETGALLFQVVRKPGKQFRQRRPDGAGGWVWNLKGTRRVLYRLPRVLEAVAAGETVYVCEGEKDVHALERAGVTATCNPGGAGKWRDDYAQALEGTPVVVIGDRDDAGRRHAAAVAASLRGQGPFRRAQGAAARSVRLVEAATGKDAADHLAAGRTVEQFVDVEPGEPAPAPARTGDERVDHTGPVIDAVRAYQVIEDPDVIRVALAVAATSGLDGEPLWLQIVGGPSSGKSEAITMLRDVVDGRVGEITAAGLLGWTGGAKGHMTGLLARIGDGKRLATITDFSTILGDADRKGRAQLFSHLRIVYDGHLIRELGTAPRPLEWEGRLTLISAVTPQIDAFSSHTDALGPRWLYVRVAEPTRAARKSASGAARGHAGVKEQLRHDARALAVRAVDVARDRIAGVEVSDADGDRLEDAAIVATLIRSDVPRDGYTRRVTGEVVREEPYRMVTMLVALYRGLRALGLHGIDARRITMRVAVDSAPLTRRRVLDVLRQGEPLTTNDVARALGADGRVAKIALEDLQLLRVTESQRIGAAPTIESDDDDDRRPRKWTLAGDDGKLAARILEDVSRNVGHTHTSPPVNRRAPHTSAHAGTAQESAS